MADETAFPADADIDEVIAEFDGDPREAIKALLNDLSELAEDYGRSVSTDFVRGGGRPCEPQMSRERIPKTAV